MPCVHRPDLNRTSADELPEILTPLQVSELTTLSEGALAQLRYTARGPMYLKPTARKVLYRRDHVLAWLDASARCGTGEA